LGDFNADATPDPAVAGSAGTFPNLTGAVGVLLGNGNGTFQAPIPSTVVGAPDADSVAVGDFNGDGRPDLAVADQLGDTVSLLLGKGDGSFAFPPAVYPAGQSPSALAAGDFNGDGLPDLAVANPYAATVRLLLNRPRTPP